MTGQTVAEPTVVCADDGVRTERRRDLSVAAALFVLLTGVYMLTYSGYVVSTDELGLAVSVESLVKRGDFSMHQIQWYGYDMGTFEPAQILAAAPLFALALQVPGVGAVQAAYLLNVLVTALTGALIYLYVLRLGYRSMTGVAVSLLWGLATTAWVYSKFFFREPLAALALVACAYFLLGLRQAKGAEPWWRQPAQALLTVGAFALAVATKETMIVALPALLAAAVLGWAEGGAWRRGPSRGQLLFVASAALAAIGLFGLLMSYNAQISGAPSLGSRRVTDAITSVLTVTPEMWSAMLQMPFSPGKGLFTHSPLLLLAFVSVPVLVWRRRYAEAALPVLMVLLFFRGYASTWWIWWGGLGWGPRYFVPLLPFLAIALAPVVEQVLAPGSRFVKAGFAILVAVSAAVQVVGVSVSVLLFAEVLASVREDAAWTLAISDPRYSEIVGNLRLLRPENLDFAWVRYWDGQTSIDWLPPFLCALVIAVGLAALVRLARRVPTRRATILLLLAAVVAPAMLAVTLLPRYFDDPHYRREKEWYPLLQTLARNERQGDVLILNLPTHTEFVLNYSKARLPWYGLAKATWPLQRPGPLSRLLTDYQRIWLATEFFPEADSFRGVEGWLSEHAFRLSDTQFGYPARLQLYLTPSQPAPDLTGAPAVARFGQQVELVASSYPTRTIQAGDPVPVSIYWRASSPSAADFTVSLQLWDAAGAMIGQIDRPPVNGFRPTSGWGAGELVRDNFALSLPDGLPSGYYRLVVSMYQWPTLERLTLDCPDGLRLAEPNVMLLGQVAVGEPAIPPLPYPVLR